MSVYTISADLLANIEKDEGIYFTDILFVFTQRNNAFKVAKDKNGYIIDTYKKVINNGDIIKTWLDLMSFKPTPFETIDIDLSKINCDETKFLKICKETKGQNKLIVYTIQNIKNFECQDNTVIFENVAIRLIDRDLARKELMTPLNGDVYINSQVARDNSQIIKSKNK
ncbi:hypothetical protein L3C95_08785 [Chitinophaga filiformis]|uniref:hypothetical protein n=1 Tax=Chitinophaga filiformis TaxID=104663 RepID=UPI001F397F37|nr:hypothetical protein [Chitinophaga filiformis]MCF6402966.1 hypothetical protein [Chitinophaga filiformis]